MNNINLDLIDYTEKQRELLIEAGKLGLDTTLLVNPDIPSWELIGLYRALLYGLDIEQLQKHGFYQENVDMLLINHTFIPVKPNRNIIEEKTYNGFAMKLGYDGDDVVYEELLYEMLLKDEYIEDDYLDRYHAGLLDTHGLIPENFQDTIEFTILVNYLDRTDRLKTLKVGKGPKYQDSNLMRTQIHAYVTPSCPAIPNLINNISDPVLLKNVASSILKEFELTGDVRMMLDDTYDLKTRCDIVEFYEMTGVDSRVSDLRMDIDEYTKEELQLYRKVSNKFREDLSKTVDLSI